MPKGVYIRNNPNGLRDSHFKFMMTEKEKEQLLRQSELRGMKAAEYLRYLIRKDRENG